MGSIPILPTNGLVDMVDARLKMHIGDLVKITRASIGVPKDSIGLIVDTRISSPNAIGTTYFIHEIQLCGLPKRQSGNRHYIERDLFPIRKAVHLR